MMSVEEELKTLDIEQTIAWIENKGVKLSDKSKTIFKSEEIKGSNLIGATLEKLVHIFKLPAGTADDLLKILPSNTGPAQLVTGIANLTTQDNDEFTKFWKAALTFKVESLRENEVFDLGQGVSFLGERKFGSRVFVRECYLELLDLVLNGGMDVLVRGTPGIGKTHFSFLLILRLIAEGKTVVYERRKGAGAYLFSSTEVQSGRSFKDFREVGSKETFLILDAIDVDVINARTILVSSPNESNFHDFVKKIDPTKDAYYMPPWSLEEILDCNGKMYNRNVPAIRAGYEKVGGVPRILLEKETVDIGPVNDAITTTSGLSWKDISRNLAVNSQVSGKVFHMIPTADLRNFEYRFASKYVEDEVFSRISDNSEATTCQFIRDSRSLGEAGGLAGVLFERIAHLRLEKGGDFEVRSLDGRSPDTKLKLPKKSPKKRFTDINEIAGFSVGDYIVPKASNFESVDSMMKPNLLFQMTVSASHPCKQAGLHKAIAALSPGGSSSPTKKQRGSRGQTIPVQGPPPTCLYFVVPDDLFASFQSQKYIDAKDQELKQVTYSDVATIQQFVLKIKL